MRLIDADKINFLWAPIAPVYILNDVHYEPVAFKWEIDAQPTIDAEPVKQAHVVWARQNTSYQTQCCSNCHRTYIRRHDETIQFCPHCGAKMYDTLEELGL